MDLRDKSKVRHDRIGSLKDENNDLKREISCRDQQIVKQKGRLQALTT